MQVLRSLALVAFVAGIGLLLIGFACGGSDEDQPGLRPVQEFDLRSATATATNATTTPEGTPSPTVPVPTATPFDGAVSRMKISRLGIDFPIEYLGIIPGENQLDTPHDATGSIGWYTDKIGYPGFSKPGFGANSVFSAHVNYNGKDGPFANLYKATAEDQVTVVMENGLSYTYQVFSVHRYATEARYARPGQEVIDMGKLISTPDKPANEEWITLITCSCEPGRIVNRDANGFGECVDRDVVVAKRIT